MRAKAGPSPKNASTEVLRMNNEELEPLGREQRVRTKRILFSPMMKGQYHQAVDFPQVQSVKVDYKKESIMGMYERAGYASRKGVIHAKVDNDAPPPP